MKLLFVCLGNICRSPAAEGVMQEKLKQEGMFEKVYCESAGTIGHHAGELADPRMREQAKKRGIELVSRSRQFVTPDDFEEFDRILVMDEKNFSDIKSLGHEKFHKVKMMTDYCQKYKDTFVPDPYFGGVEGFDYVLDLLDDACHGLLQEIKKEIS